MSLEEKIIESVKALPAAKQIEVLDFVEYLKEKSVQREQLDWTDFSLSSAMRGMEDENTPYSVNDLKEKFA